jgi:hypothetical protein
MMPFLSLFSKFSEMASSVGVGSSTCHKHITLGNSDVWQGGSDHVVDAMRHLRLHPVASVFSHRV